MYIITVIMIWLIIVLLAISAVYTIDKVIYSIKSCSKDFNDLVFGYVCIISISVSVIYAIKLLLLMIYKI